MGLLYFEILLGVLPLLLYYYCTRTFNYWKTRNVVTPKPLPLVGNMKDLFLRRKNIGVVFEEIYNMFPDEKVVGIYTMTPQLLIRDLDIIKRIMIKDFDSFMDRGFDFAKKGLSANLFSTDGDTWRTLRSHFTPIFTSRKLKNMFYLMEERADKFMDFMDKQCNKHPEQEIREFVKKFTISSISACAFGVDIDTLGDDKLDALKIVDRLVLTPSFFRELDMMFPGVLKKINISAVPKAVEKFILDLVKNIMIQRNDKPTNRNDFMDLVLELRQQGRIQCKDKFGNGNVSLEMTEDVMAAQAFIFYVGGYETSATTLSYVLHEIAIKPEIQDKLIKELDESLRLNDGKMTYNSLKEMKYMDQVISETLRLHSIIEPLQRRARVDYKIPGTDVVVKRGQIVFISPRGIHRDGKYYDNPEVFDPERFSPEAAGARHSCAYIPFGTGPRYCIGKRFSRIQTRLCLAKILSKFRVEPSINTKKFLEVEPKRIMIGPKGGVHVNFVHRK